jgi:hypothetical protein
MNPAEAPGICCCWPTLARAVKRYLPGSTCFAARQTTQFTPSGLGALIGVCVLVPEGDGLHRWELMNMAVGLAEQGHRFGPAAARHP